MDKFLTPTVIRGPEQFCSFDNPLCTPIPGYVTSGFANFVNSGPWGFTGATDPTFAGIPVTATSPLECNTKATSYALLYNGYAKTKYDYGRAMDKYISDKVTYDIQRKTGNLPEPLKPTDPMPGKYTPSEVLFFEQIATQSARCVADEFMQFKCSPSIGRSAVIGVDGKWQWSTDGNVNTAQPSIQDVVWSFVADVSKAPFGKQCQIHYRPLQVPVGELLFDDGTTASVTGVGNSDCGANTLATVPYIRQGCAPSEVGQPQATECTVLAERHSQASLGYKWYLDGLTDEGSTSQTSVVERICNDYPLLQECDCLAREERPNFNLFKTNFSTTSPICWYLPCSLPGDDRLVTPQQSRARDDCNANVCQSIVNVVNSETVDLKDVQNTINCTAAQYEAGMKAAAGGGGTTDVISGTLDQIKEITGQISTEVIIAIVCGAIVLLLLILAAWLFFKSSPSPPSSPPPPPPPPPSP